MRAQAILVDAVGTIIRPRESPADVYARVAARHGIERRADEIAPALRKRLAGFAPPPLGGVPASRIPELERAGWREVIREVLGNRAAEGRCFDALFDLYGQADAWAVLDGAPEALASARERGARVAVVSNMDARLPTLLAGLGLAEGIDELVLPSNSGWAKPDPRIFHCALDRLEVPKHCAVYVGDREEDCVEAARAAGIEGLRYDPEGDPDDPNVLPSWDALASRIARRPRWPIARPSR